MHEHHSQGMDRRARRRRRRLGIVAAVLAAAMVAPLLITLAVADAGAAVGPGDPDTGYPRDDELRLNEVQVVGTHNSYHLPLNPVFKAGLEELYPGLTALWDYEHRPLPEQFGELGVRQIELDVFADPDGGLFTNRVAHEFAGLPADPGIPELYEPGFKVLHIQELDVESTCWTFVSCLTQLRTWSQANPGHAPIMILVEAKDDPIPDPVDLGFLIPVEIDGAQLDALDAEIRSVFSEDEMITPDDVRGERATLEEAVLTDGWPTLADSRGKVMFGLDNGGSMQADYLEGHPSLEGRVLFTGGSGPGQPHTAFIKYNNPVGSYDDIQAAVAAGYIVRTRADADPTQQNPDLFADRDTAMASGAQFLSTDFPEPDDRYESGYEVRMPGDRGVRCNPISGPGWCEPQHVETPLLLGGPTACDPDGFTDVGVESPYCSVLTWMADAGVLTGTGDGGVAPTAPLTRQGLALQLARLDGEVPEGPCDTTDGFSDVPADHPFCGEIMWLAGTGAITGYPDGTFGPTRRVTRQSLAAVLSRMDVTDLPTPAGATQCPDPGPFVDVPPSHPFCDPISWMADRRISDGFADGTYRPTADLTRQATAALIWRWHAQR